MKSKTILAVADIHMSNKLPHARLAVTTEGETGITDRLYDQRKLWAGIYQVAEKDKVDAIFVLGDLFDKANVDPITFTETLACLAYAPCPIYIMAGNHDAATAAGERYVVEAFRYTGHERLQYVEGRLYPSWGDGWLRFHCIPYGPADKVMQKIRSTQDTIVRAPPGVDVLMLHHSIVGCRHLGWTCDQGLDQEVICEGFDQVLAGHFHEQQTFGPDGVGMYLGAPMHHNFGDAGRAAHIHTFKYDWDEKANTLEIGHTETDLNLPKFHVWDANLSPPMSETVMLPDPLEMVRSGMGHGDYCRITVRCSRELWASGPQEMLGKLCEELEEKWGVHASIQFKPISVYKKRIVEVASVKDAVDIPSVIKAYAKGWEGDSKDLPAVVGVGLNIWSEVEHVRRAEGK